MQPISEGLTFDDVLLVPQRSPLASRKEASVKTQLTKNVSLNIPIIPANMDTVTESAMAIAIAKLGGFGFIHRFMAIERQVSEVKKVKRQESVLIDNPAIVEPDLPVGEARKIMRGYNITCVLVVDKKGILAGILTRRDWLNCDNNTDPVKKFMTPKSKLITAQKGISIEAAKKILYTHRIEKLPIVDKKFKLIGLFTTKDISERAQYPLATKDPKGRLMVGAAVGVMGDYIERAEALVHAGADVLLIDIAHGHSDLMIKAIKDFNKRFPRIEIVAGNVATAEGTVDLIKAGADCIKVGVGSGSICITRIVTGCGVPQMSAIMACSAAAKKYGVPIIADSGIKNSGDIVKALAAGGDTVMIGGLFAGTEESTGITVIRNGQKYKVTRGMASLTASMSRTDKSNGKEDDMEKFRHVVPEGVEAMVPYRGHVAEMVEQLVGGLKSGLSYCGSHSISEMQKKAQFIRMSPAGLRESYPHDNQLL
jgi:IMP dehydrogenase